MDAMLLKIFLFGRLRPDGECEDCGGPAGLYVVEGQYCGLCARCVAQRIRHLRERGVFLPEWAAYLEREVIWEIRSQKDREEQLLKGVWDELYKCTRCGKTVTAMGAKYPKDCYPGSAVDPHCQDCYEIVMAASTCAD